MKKVMFLFILLVGLLLAACGGDQEGADEDSSNSSEESSDESSENSEGTEGGTDTTVTYASTSDAVGLSPILTNDSVSSRVIEQVYETLFTRNLETGEIEPRLAESYETPDDTTWVIKLKEDIEFHDGTPFNAEAVKYTFEKFMDPETAAPRASLLDPVESIEVQDEHTVVINTTEPYGAMLATLSHSNASIVSPEANENQNLNENPVGTGPYQFAEWTKGDQIVLEKNTNYWQGEPEIDEAVFKVVPSVSTALSMMETGEVDFIDGVTQEHLARLESNDSLEVVTKDGTPVYYFGFNHGREPMNEFEFRKALSHAIDRDAYVETLDGLGVRSNSIIGPQVFGYDESAEDLGFNYDPEEAKRIIEENGYDEVELNLLVANRDLFTNMSEIVQAQLTEVGLNVNIEMIEWGSFLDLTAQGEFDLTFLSWSNTTADGSELLYPNLHQDNVGSSNRMRYANDEFDELVEASRTTTDQEERAEYLQQANEIAVEEVAWAPMHHGVVAAAVHESIEGFAMDPTGRWEIYQFSKN